MEKREVSDIGVTLSCQIERVEAIQAFMEDVIEEYSACGMTNRSEKLQKANLKLISLSSFLEREIKDMNETVGKLLEVNMEGEQQ